MSSTDQAFMRAYGAPAETVGVSLRKPPLAKTLAALNSLEPQIGELPEAKTESILAHAEVAHSADTFHACAETLPAPPALRIACFDIGVGTVIPPPHAGFASRKIASPGSEQVGTQRAERSRLHFSGLSTAKPAGGWGQSPKAALSSFSTATRPKETLKPAMEIDSVVWPRLCETLIERCAPQFRRLAEEIRLGSEQGQRVVAISGIGRGEGRTTFTLCLARQLALSSKVAIVDADFQSAGIATQFRIAIEQGFEAVLAGETSLADAMIESVQDRFALLPLSAGPHSAAAFRIHTSLRELADYYDTVLVDAGPIAEGSPTRQWLCDVSGGVDAVILTRDVRQDNGTQLATACELLDSASIQTSIAETFTRSEGSSHSS